MKSLLTKLLFCGILLLCTISSAETSSQLALKYYLVWAKQNLQYISEPAYMDIWKAPGQTLQDGGGDCEDLAILAQQRIERLGITNTRLIWIIYGEGDGHVVLIWKASEGFCIVSNIEGVCTTHSTINELLNEVYPDWLAFRYTTPQRKVSWPVWRRWPIRALNLLYRR